MSTVLSRQDIINIIYGATVLGAGGGGSASSGLEMLENYIKKHGDPKLRMISTGEMNVNAYAAVMTALFTLFDSGTKRDAMLPVPMIPMFTCGRSSRNCVEDIPCVRGRYTTWQNSFK